MRAPKRQDPSAKDLMSAPWRAFAACRTADPDLFFGADTKAAKAICAQCPAQAACLDMALADQRLVGVWGGTTDAGRRRLRSAARRAARQAARTAAA